MAIRQVAIETLRFFVIVSSPERRQRPVIALRDEFGLRIASALSVVEAGFSLHAAITAPADDARAREALCKYVLRPPLAQERLHLLEDGWFASSSNARFRTVRSRSTWIR